MTNTTVVIYGASGDLSKRKLLPALYNLFRKNRLPGKLQILGLGRTEWTDDEFRQEMEEALQEFASKVYDKKLWKKFANQLHYLAGNFTTPDEYGNVIKRLDDIEEQACNRIFYLAMPPRFYKGIIEAIGVSGIAQEERSWRRVVIEKPFGHDLKSAHDLNLQIHEHLEEHQIYRIDHFLAKETVQNILVLRFGNSIFEPLWNRNYIDHVQIMASETVDVGQRASYYDNSGVVRDMFQNHLMQLLSIISMEPPASFDASALRNEKVKALSAVRKFKPEDVNENTVRAQYEGYTKADGVPPESETPTYAAVRFFLDNWRWQGVPFYLRSGKALQEKVTQITIQFKNPPHMMFPSQRQIPGNKLTLTIQPDEAIHLRIEAKVPDTIADLQPVDMHFHYGDSFDEAAIPEAYERLLRDVLNGDPSLFTRDDEVELSWRIVDPILEGWRTDHAPPLTLYKRNSWGPYEADRFMRRDDREWIFDDPDRHD